MHLRRSEIFRLMRPLAALPDRDLLDALEVVRRGKRNDDPLHAL